VAVFEEFLAPIELTWVHQLVGSQAAAFQPSQVIGAQAQGVQDPHYRCSSVLYDLGGLHQLMSARLLWFMPHILYRLGLAPFEVRDVEVQLTSSGNGGFFGAHTDSDNGPVSSRTVTFVLFCHREPCAFSGGTLQVYGRDPASGEHAPQLVTAVRPSQNRMVLFPSDRLHEVMPVSCPARDLLDTRLTLNGWLHR
jgi:Rps23 Pro-64 3,4-dihydroxylase Tpa1-like proline 4-hydroxylase